MKLVFRLALAAATAALAFSGAAQAQQQYDKGGKARVSIYCTTTTPGDTACTGTGGGGGSNAAAGATGSAVPSSGSYNAFNIGGILRGQTGVNPSGSIFAGQVDIASWGGTSVSLGAGPATNVGRVVMAQDATTIGGSAPGTAGTPSTNVISVQGVSSGTALGVSSVDGGIVSIGAVGDSAWSGSGNGSVIAVLKDIDAQARLPLAAGSALIGKAGIDQTTPGTTNGVTEVPATAGGPTVSTFEPAASDNHTNLKNGAGQIYWVTAFNNSATINYIRFYNAATGFNGCASATNLVATMHVPANTSDAGFTWAPPGGVPFSTGISYCVVSAYGQTTTTSATATAMDINIGYK